MMECESWKGASEKQFESSLNLIQSLWADNLAGMEKTACQKGKLH